MRAFKSKLYILLSIKSLINSLLAFARSDNEKFIVVKLREKITSRTIRNLLVFFKLSGYKVLIRKMPVRTLISLGHDLSWHPETHWMPVLSSKMHETDVLCDDEVKETNTPLFHKNIHIRYDYTPYMDLPKHHYTFPYPMHSQIYVQYFQHTLLDKYRSSKRKIRLLFAGNYGPGYNHSLYSEVYGMVDRNSIIELIKKQDLALIVENREELDFILSGDYRDQFIFLDKSLRINQASWLELLSSSDFFLCPPGILFPISHNLTEAMAVGTIPVTNYPHWYYPALKGNKNSLCFETEKELLSVVNEVLLMNQDQISDLRKNVIQYYSDFLDPSAVMQRMINDPRNEIYLHVLVEQENFIRESFKNISTRK